MYRISNTENYLDAIKDIEMRLLNIESQMDDFISFELDNQFYEITDSFNLFVQQVEEEFEQQQKED